MESDQNRRFTLVLAPHARSYRHSRMKMKSIIIIFGLIVSSTVFAGSQYLSKKDFTASFIRKVSAELRGATFSTVSDLQIRSTNLGGYEINIFLYNAYDVYRAGQKPIGEIFNNQINSIKGQRLALENKDVKTILPVLKPKDYIVTIKKQLKDAGYEKENLPLYIEKLNDDIYILFVFDTPESMRFLSPEDLEELNISAINIRNIAKGNLENYYKNLSITIQQINTKGRGSVYMFSADGNYEASAILSSSLLQQDKIPLKSDFIVFVPARNKLLIVGVDDREGIQEASNLALKDYAELGYSISPYGYRKKGDRWERIRP